MNNIQILPSNIEAEQALLGAMLLEPKIALDALRQASPEHFYLEKHRAIAEAIYKLSASGNEIDILTVDSELKGLDSKNSYLSYLTSLFNAVPSAQNYESYARLIRGAFDRRRTINNATKIIDAAFDPNSDSSALATDAAGIFLEQASDKSSADFMSAFELGEENDFFVESSINNPKDVWGVPTGYPMLDDVLGGWQKQAVYIVAGNASVGKTFFVLSSLLYLAYAKHPCAIVSMEMSNRQLFMRLLAIMSNIPSDHIQRGKTEQDDAWVRLSPQQKDAIRNAKEKFKTLPIYFSREPIRSAVDIRVAFKKLKQKHGIVLGAVDYLQLMGDSASENRNNEIGAESRMLKNTANELDMALLVSSQLSRDNTKRPDKRAQLSDLRDSGSIEQDADVVILLHSSEYWEKVAGRSVDTNTEYELIEAVIPKDRLGRAAGCKVLFGRNRKTGFYTDIGG